MAMALSRTNVPIELATTDDQREAKYIVQAIEDIAVQFSRPSSEVQEILMIHISRLEQQACVKRYVSLLAISR
jgi:hypothetical protein